MKMAISPALLKIHENRIDRSYLEEIAKKNRVDDFLAEIMKS